MVHAACKRILSKGVYKSTCVGAAEDCSSGFDKASATCNGKL
jgi:hypothetical protein